VLSMIAEARSLRLNTFEMSNPQRQDCMSQAATLSNYTFLDSTVLRTIFALGSW